MARADQGLCTGRNAQSEAIAVMATPEIRKEHPADGYPPEEGCYLRGNDFSPVAVAVILRWEREKTPPSIEQLVRVAVESGAALAGTLQTENVGLEKVICNVVEKARSLMERIKAPVEQKRRRQSEGCR